MEGTGSREATTGRGPQSTRTGTSSAPITHTKRLPRLLGDVGRKGQRLTFSTDAILASSVSSRNPTAYLEIIVSYLPASTREFYQSLQRYYDTEGSPSAEPAPLRSNVTGGYGPPAGATGTALRIKF